MSEMRTELMYVKFPEGVDEYEYCNKDEAEGTAVAFTAIHPTELTPVLDGDGEPTGDETPQEYGILAILTDVLDNVSDLNERYINMAVLSLKEAGCLVEEAETPECPPEECACGRN